MKEIWGLWPFSFCLCSSTISKHWEAELATLKGNNAKLTAALLESTANVKQWKQQLAAYQEEAERLHKRVSNSRQMARILEVEVLVTVFTHFQLKQINFIVVVSG